VTGYGPDDWCSIPYRGKRLFLLDVVQTGSGAHTTSYPKDTRSSFPEGKAAGREADHSPPASAEVKNDGAKLSLPRMLLLHNALLIKHGDISTFTLTLITSVPNTDVLVRIYSSQIPAPTGTGT
jgi:hypothetical protein